MYFPKRQFVSRVLTGNALGSQISFDITRDFFLDNVVLELSGTVTTAAATASADGILGLVKRVQLSVADGAANRLQTDVSAVSAIQKAFQRIGSIDQGTLNTYLLGNVTGTFLIRIPLLFLDVQLPDPAGSAFMLPLPRYNANPTLNVQFATQADMDINGSPTFAISAGVTARLIINKRQVDDIRFPTFETEFIEASKSYPTTEPQSLYNLQTPGSYFNFGIRGYTSTAAWGDVSSTDGLCYLNILGNTLRQSRFSDIAYDNQLSIQDNWTATTVHAQKNGLFPGLAFYDFLSDQWGMTANECGSVLNANVLAGSGSNVEFKQDVTGGAGVRNAFFWDRVFGDLSMLKPA